MFKINRKLNFQTIRVFTFIACDKAILSIAKNSETYKDFTDSLIGFGITSTSDNVSLSDMDLDYKFLDELIQTFKKDEYELDPDMVRSSSFTSNILELPSK